MCIDLSMPHPMEKQESNEGKLVTVCFHVRIHY